MRIKNRIGTSFIVIILAIYCSVLVVSAEVKSQEEIEYYESIIKNKAIIDSDDKLWLWGEPYRWPEENRDIILKPTKAFADVKSMHETSCIYVLKDDGTLWGWGVDFQGSLATGTPGEKYPPVKILDNVKEMGSSYDVYYALKNDGSLWTWGTNYNGEIGNGKKQIKPLKDFQATPYNVLNNVLKVEFNHFQMYAIKTDGTLWAWGRNFGKLGNGKNDAFQLTPTKITNDVKSVVLGGEYTLIIKQDNSLWSIGQGGEFNMGNGIGKVTTTNYPTKMLTNVKKAETYTDATFALKKDGTLWSWGNSLYGSLGNGSLHGQRGDASKVLSNVENFYLYSNTLFAIKTDGTLWAWGENYCGIVGNGSTKYQTTPTKILDNVTYLNLDDNYIFDYNISAITKDGTLWSWGSNEYYEAGVGNTGEILKPVKTLDNVVWANDYNTALKKDGTLWSWGNNVWGQVGNGNTEMQPTPVQIYEGIELFNLEDYYKRMPISDVYSTKQTATKVIVDGTSYNCNVYNVENTNYFKLRDIAYLLKGTNKEFNISFDDSASTLMLTHNNEYSVTGSEMLKDDGKTKYVVFTGEKILVEDEEHYLKKITVNGSNYFSLRELGDALGCEVKWNNDLNGIEILTNGK